MDNQMLKHLRGVAATARGVLLALIACLILGDISFSPEAGAQPVATPGPIRHVPIMIPANPPKGWDATTWTRLRQQCQEIADKSDAGIPMTRAEFEASQTCNTMGPYPPSATRERSAPPPQGEPSPASADTDGGLGA